MDKDNRGHTTDAAENTITYKMQCPLCRQRIEITVDQTARIQELGEEIKRKNKYIEDLESDCNDMDEIIDQLRKALEFYANEALNK